MRPRYLLRKILSDPCRKRELMISVIKDIQNRARIVPTWEQARDAYDKIQREREGGAK